MYRDVCYGTEWSSFIWFAFLGVLVYIIGIPLTFAIVLKRHAHKLALSETFCNRFGFLYARYTPECYYWEICELLRKSLITITVMFAAPGSVMQYASTLYVSITFMGFHIAYVPFKSTRENVLQVILTLTLTLPENDLQVFCHIHRVRTLSLALIKPESSANQVLIPPHV